MMMASCRVMWILSALALASCAVIGTTASNPTRNDPVEAPKTIDELEAMLEIVSLTQEEIEKLLDEYEHKEDKINRRTIGELNELCRPSIEKCTIDGFTFITDQTACYFRDSYGLTKLYEYGKYCRYTKLTKYCYDNINTVVENLLKNITKEDEELVGSFWKSLRDSGVIDRAHSVEKDLFNDKKRAEEAGANKVEAIKDTYAIQRLEGKERDATIERYRKEAYDAIYDEGLMKAEQARKEIDDAIYKAFLVDLCKRYASSLDEQELFLYKFTQAIDEYRDIHHFVLNTSGNDESGSKLNEGVVSDVFKFGRIAQRFYIEVGKKCFRKLQAKLKNLYGKPDVRTWWTFRDETEEEFMKSRVERDQTSGKSVLKASGVGDLLGRYSVCN